MIMAITIENFKGISEPVRLELRPCPQGQS
jgi:hypothetical protein